VTQDYLKSSPSVHFNAIGLLGDIASIYQESIKYAIKVDPVMRYIEKFKQSNDPTLRDTAVYSYNHIDLL
jgi:hypothetical protein